ncbi:hypothetical protein CEXT_5611 [Caerostris extrusa]|uniref:PiggyBac transposable element-derived protein domain-containing protein n=1 Tax=Caerostris extrusa TaxID=172846 RepID=A0AAV4QFD5_CAEEX|nr:hypothetical protein CEXT_5611 [Caerostris extrusa]
MDTRLDSARTFLARRRFMSRCRGPPPVDAQVIADKCFEGKGEATNKQFYFLYLPTPLHDIITLSTFRLCSFLTVPKMGRCQNLSEFHFFCEALTFHSLISLKDSPVMRKNWKVEPISDMRKVIEKRDK